MATHINEADQATETRGNVAFNELLPEFMALPSDQLTPVAVDVKSAVITVLASVPKVRAILPELLKKSTEIDEASLSKLERKAYALSWAHARYLSAGKTPSELQEMVETGAELRDQLFSDAQALARRGLIEPSQLKEVQSGTGYKNLATDLTILSSVLSENWKKIQGKSAIEFSELNGALLLGERILKALAAKEGAPAVAEATDMRERVFTSVADAYDDVRRVVSYVRWKERDVEELAPSLYSGRGGRRRDESEVPAAGEGPEAPVAPGAAPAAGVTRAAASSTDSQNGGETDPFLK